MTLNRKRLRVCGKTEGEGGSAFNQSFHKTLTLRLPFYRIRITSKTPSRNSYYVHAVRLPVAGGVMSQRTLPLVFDFLILVGSCSWRRAR